MKCPDPPTASEAPKKKPSELPDFESDFEYRLTRRTLEHIRSSLPDVQSHELYQEAEATLEKPGQNQNTMQDYERVLQYRQARALAYEAMARTLETENRQIRRRIEQLGKIQHWQHKLDTPSSNGVTDTNRLSTGPANPIQASEQVSPSSRRTQSPGILTPAVILFRPGSTRLSSRDKEQLARVAKVLRSYPQYRIRVIGHSDTTPISTRRFSSNWELSAQRALSVLQYLVRDENIDQDRFELEAYGGQKPRVPNNSPRNRARNRRVEIRLISPEGSHEAP